MSCGGWWRHTGCCLPLMMRLLVLPVLLVLVVLMVLLVVVLLLLAAWLQVATGNTVPLGQGWEAVVPVQVVLFLPC